MSNKETYEEKEAERRFQQTLRGALVTPHRPHEKEASQTRAKRDSKGAGKNKKNDGRRPAS
jgi:hypothetical protein